VLGNQPLVSVIVNCHNGEKYLSEALDSIFSQSYKIFEIIFWDNASTDSSSHIAKSYQSIDSRLKYFHADKTISLGEARDLAINESNGKLLSFLDCDDLWLPSKLEKQVKLFVKNEATVGFIYSRCSVISEYGVKTGEINNAEDVLRVGEIFGELVKKNFIPFVSALVSKKKYYEVGGFPKAYKNCTDYDLFLKLSYKYHVLAVDEILCKYREHANNRSHSLYVIGAKEGLESVSNFLPDPRAKIGLKYQYVQLTLAYLKDKSYKNAIYLLIRHGGLIMLFQRLFNKIRVSND